MVAIPVEKRAELVENAAKICAPGKGILAADESTGTIGKRFGPIGVENTEENRRRYRELLFTAPETEKYFGGIIFYEETLHQKTSSGKPFVQLVTERGILPGIKIDLGLIPIPGTNGETVTQGLDDLDKRCAAYYKIGARFTKWRCALSIGSDGRPSELAIQANAETLARMAVISQMNGLVPIVEPEILMDGDHDLGVAIAAAERVLVATYARCALHGLYLEGSLLKPNMVCPGSDCPKKYTPYDIAQATVTAFKRTVPPAVAGITFLSGGQSEEEATVHLNAINQVNTLKPWPLTFSYGRALQSTVLKVWKGEEANVAAAQAALLKRGKANGEAALGKYAGDAADDSAKASLFVKNYSY